MPRPTHAQGRPGTEVIPVDWEATHRPVAEKTMTASIALAHPATGQHRDDATEQMVADEPAVYWSGKARVQRVSLTGTEATAAADPEAVAGYLITVPADVAPLEGDLASLAGTGDPALDGHILDVLQVTRGSLRFERDLFCTLTT